MTNFSFKTRIKYLRDFALIDLDDYVLFPQTNPDFRTVTEKQWASVEERY